MATKEDRIEAYVDNVFDKAVGKALRRMNNTYERRISESDANISEAKDKIGELVDILREIPDSSVDLHELESNTIRYIEGQCMRLSRQIADVSSEMESLKLQLDGNVSEDEPGIDYHCPECGIEIDEGQDYCECGEFLEWGG